MDFVAISRINLKHLSTLHVMLSTHSVTKSAEQLCISPSSVSKTLSQLRDILSDELFYRDGTQLIPTPYALKIAPTVHQVLRQMNGLLNQTNFDPQQFSGKFTLAMRESTFELMAPTLSHISTQISSSAQLEIHAKEQFGFEALLSGKVDALILPHDKSQPITSNKQLVWETILEDEMVCLMHPQHPLKDEELTTSLYLQFPHIGIFDDELNQPYFEQVLKQSHQPRNLVFSVADFGSAAILCSQTEHLFTCSKQWSEIAKQATGLISKPLPFDYGQVAYSIVSNKQSHNDQAMRWLFEQIKLHI